MEINGRLVNFAYKQAAGWVQAATSSDRLVRSSEADSLRKSNRMHRSLDFTVDSRVPWEFSNIFFSISIFGWPLSLDTRFSQISFTRVFVF